MGRRSASRRAVIADFAAIAAQEKSPLNAVLLGAVAATGVLPIPADAFRAAIRAEGKAVDANLRGFEAGVAGSDPAARAMGSDPIAPPAIAERASVEGLTPSLHAFHPEARAVLAHGVERLTDYQDAAYASRYLARVARFVGKPGADGAFIRELGRHLAVRMSVEDVIRVAQLKLREARLDRVRARPRRARRHVDVTEYLARPRGGVRPAAARLGRWALARVRHDRAWLLKVTTTRSGLPAPQGSRGPQALAPAHAALCRGGGVGCALA
jgi:indolepyruvate ferredoxin oxidoreductase beta subunit